MSNTSGIKIDEFMHNHMFLYADHWHCDYGTMDKPRKVKLGLMVEIVDLVEHGLAKEGDSYTYALQMGILPNVDSIEPSVRKDMEEQAYVKEGELTEFNLYISHHAVPANIDGIKSPQERWDRFESMEDDAHGYRFISEDGARMFVRDVVVPRVSALFVMIGFVLDKRVNPIGTTGWDLISAMVFGTDCVGETIKRRQAEEQEDAGEA